MLTERIERLKSWFREEIEQQKEFSRFHTFFKQMRLPDGVLARPGERISPVMRGFVTAQGSLGLMSKVVEGKELSAKERKRVREAAWLTSLTGTYEIGELPEGGAEVRVAIENDEVMDYLTENADKNTMVAFLSYKDDRHWRYKESPTVNIVQLDGSPKQIAFSFLQANHIHSDGRKIYIYTRPMDSKRIDKRFLRLYLMLGL